MALRAQNDSATVLTSLSHLVGLPVFWHDANTMPYMEREKWLDLFQIAIMAKYSISITEMAREVTQQQTRVRSLMGDLYEDPANKKVISAIYISLDEAARKQFRGEFSILHFGH